MKSLTLHVPDKTAAKIDYAARKLGVTTETLLRTSIEEKLDRVDFEQTAAQVLMFK